MKRLPAIAIAVLVVLGCSGAPGPSVLHPGSVWPPGDSGAPTTGPAPFEFAAPTTDSPAPVTESRLPHAQDCAAFDLSARRCQAIVDTLAAGLKVKPTDATSIELLGDPGCGGGPGDLCIRSTSFVVRVRFHMPDGSAPEDSVFCGVGGQYSILCTESPEVRVAADLMHNGYVDLPCAGKPPKGCASPVPTIDPAAATDARPLLVEAVDIPLHRVGEYSVDLGNATLANGILSDASFTLADVHPTTWSTTGDGVRLVIESVDGGLPFWNIYEHGWRPGVEHVVVKAVFEITETEPGAVMQIRDVVVR